MEEINLLQNRIKDTTFAWERQSRLLLGILSLIFIVILAVTVVFYVIKTKTQEELEAATAQVATMKTQLSQKQNSVTDAKTFQAQLTNLRSLISSRTYISPFTDELSRVMYNKAKFLSMEVNQETGKIHFEGSASNYEDVGKLLLSLSTSDKFKNVKLRSVVPSFGSVNEYRFSIDMTVGSEIFTTK